MFITGFVMVTKRNYIFLFLLTLILCGAVKNSFATHISKPILIEPRSEYSIGEKVILNGWADYNAQPTADVLLNFKVSKPDDTVIIDQSHPTDQQGHFEFEFDTKNLTPGLYQITITSHCKEIHRSICSYNSQTLTIHLK
jgi:uncharacterized protein YfaS (alpha-2-macroglobulin family)